MILALEREEDDISLHDGSCTGGSTSCAQSASAGAEAST